ncbi:MAG: hypothetical protein IMY80_01145 [Chloroflexi bacterium]|nr:hypothetical protein [Chloroflexota bacterium]
MKIYEIGSKLMRTYLVLLSSLIIIVSLGSGCDSTSTPTATVAPDELELTNASITPAMPTDTTDALAGYPPVEGKAPSYRVGVFYYPWYRNLANDGDWSHWGGPEFMPPEDISSDYYPALGPYSSLDPIVVSQHFAWLREAGVGVIISSWWGQGSNEDQAVPILLELGEQYGIKVAFHIESYPGRTAESIVDDIKYIYAQYGDSPAFFRTANTSRWNPGNSEKGLFFIWSIGSPDLSGSEPVDPSYWREAIDEIHNLPDGGLVIAHAESSFPVDEGHFDGIYNYSSLYLPEKGGFSWAHGLPPGTWFVPSVIPGLSTIRTGGSEGTIIPRGDGATYNLQWSKALDAGIEPEMVTITSFNEWNKGLQIEPAASGIDNEFGYEYKDYGSVPENWYVISTNEWVHAFLTKSWPLTYQAQIKIATNSDWTTFRMVDGGFWLRPDFTSIHEGATTARIEGDNRLVLIQPLERALEGGSVDITVDILFAGLDQGRALVFEIERGGIGSTTVEILNKERGSPIHVETFLWDGTPGDRNTLTVQILPEVFINATD